MALVLVVEDNTDLREMYGEILGIGGHVWSAVEGAAEAVAAIGERRPAVVVLDLGIAGGVEPVLDALRGDPPVHVILASGARDLPERAAAIGATYLQKPFGPEQLLQAIAQVAQV